MLRTVLAVGLLQIGLVSAALPQERGTSAGPAAASPVCYLGGVGFSPGAAARTGDAVTVCQPDGRWGGSAPAAAGCISAGAFYSTGAILTAGEDALMCEASGRWAALAGAAALADTEAGDAADPRAVPDVAPTADPLEPALTPQAGVTAEPAPLGADTPAAVAADPVPTAEAPPPPSPLSPILAPPPAGANCRPANGPAIDLCGEAQRLEALIAPNLPVMVNDEMAIEAVGSNGPTLMMQIVYALNSNDLIERIQARRQDIYGFQVSLQRQALGIACSQAASAAFIALGGRIQYDYVTSDGALVHTATIQSCDAAGASGSR